MPCLRLVALIVFAGFIATPAEAKKRHHNYPQHAAFGTGCVQNNDGRTICGMSQPGPLASAPMGRRQYAPQASYDVAGITYLPHPAGCPARLFCGCGARKDLGIDDVRLNLVANWPRYYRGSTPVAVWRGHVAVIERMLGNGMAMLRDYNSGGHLSRRHVRDISRARIVGGFHTAAL